MLIKAYEAPVWSPGLIQVILRMEYVQRKFTERIPGMSGLTYHSRLKRLNFETLELRRLRIDMLLVYRILFSFVRVNSNTFFILKNQLHLHSHKYVIDTQCCFRTIRKNFFSNRVVNLWNNLPASTTDFTSLCKFNQFLSDNYLLTFCKVKF